MIDIIIVVVIAVIIGLAAMYVYRAKKSGKKCIGCPDGGCCQNSGSCQSDSGCHGGDSCHSGGCGCSCIGESVCSCSCGGKAEDNDDAVNESAES